jgi:hypothetical protein
MSDIEIYRQQMQGHTGALLDLPHDEVPCFVNTSLRLSTGFVVQMLE